jgi:hypothetical protein
MPPAPHVDDYDSDESAVIPNTRREAGNHGPPSKPLMQHMRKQGRDAASDSGYSSHASGTVASSNYSQPTSGTQHLRQSSQPVNQNPISRRESQRGQPRPSRPSSSVSKCTIPNCGDPDCASSQNNERAYTLPHRPQTQRSQTTQYPVQNPASSVPHTQAPNKQHSQHPAGQPAHNNYNPQVESRPRGPSASQSRPTSWAPGAYNYANYYQQGNPVPQAGYGTPTHGMPPSPSTYTRMPHLPQHLPTSADWQGMPPPPMISSSPRDPYGAYMPGQPMSIPSNGQNYLAAQYSARQVNPVISGQEMSPATGHQVPALPTISARRASIMPGSFPGETAAFGSASESGSDYSDSEDDYERQRREPSRRREQSRHRERSRPREHSRHREHSRPREHSRHREQSRRRREHERERARRALEASKAMPPPPRERERRPTLTHARTTPVEDSRHRSRELPRRAPHSDPDMSSSDYVDSDRTTRPVVGKRLTYSNSRELRRPAITHHESSGRERSSSLLHSSQVTSQYVVEDANGRKLYYDTREEAESKALRLNHEQRVDAAEAYMATKRGNPQPATLTTDNIKRSQTHHQAKKPSSHASGSSKKSTVSSRTSATRTSMTDSTIQIKRGDAVYTIPADRVVEIITKEGETMTIGPGSGSPPRDKTYHGGSSSSRTGRSRNGSEFGGRRRDTITEEHDGYESAL